MDYPILSDPSKEVAKAYGILSPGGNSKRVTFIIAPDGKIAHIETSVKVGTHGADIAKKLAELKFPPVKKSS